MKSNISTIQVRENVKRALARYKERDNESYEEILIKLMKKLEQKKKNQEELLKEGAIAMAEDSLRIVKEMEGADNDFDWEWEGSEKE